MFWDPYQTPRFFRTMAPIGRLQAELQRFLESPLAKLDENQVPTWNVHQSDEGLAVTALLPGVDPEEVEITIEGDLLHIAGKAFDDAAGELETKRRERRTKAFSRSLRLPYEVETDDVEATFSRGILELRLPRAKEELPVRITIGAKP